MKLLNVSPQKRKFDPNTQEYRFNNYSKVVATQRVPFPWKDISTNLANASVKFALDSRVTLYPSRQKSYSRPMNSLSTPTQRRQTWRSATSSLLTLQDQFSLLFGKMQLRKWKITPPPTHSSLPFCAHVQSSCDNILYPSVQRSNKNHEKIEGFDQSNPTSPGLLRLHTLTHNRFGHGQGFYSDKTVKNRRLTIRMYSKNVSL